MIDFENGFPGLVIRDPTTGAITELINPHSNLTRAIVEGLDYEGIYILDSSIFGHGDFGRVTFTLNGTYLSRFEFQATPFSKRIGLSGGFISGASFTVRCRTIAPMRACSTTAQLTRGSLDSTSAQRCITPASMKISIRV